MMTNKNWIFFFILMLLVHPSAYAFSEKICTEPDAIQAELEADKPNNWDALYSLFKQFSHCDDGAISEGFSDSVARLFIKNWSGITRLNYLAKKDPTFEHFVLHHIDDTIPADELKIIEQNAITRCPTGARRLCGLIAVAAKPYQE